MARRFDLAWGHGTTDVPDRLLLPVLGDELDVAIGTGDVRLGRTGHDLVLRVYEQCLPLCDESVAEIVDAVASALRRTRPAGRRRRARRVGAPALRPRWPTASNSG